MTMPLTLAMSIMMKRLGYFRDYLRGEKNHPGAYALVCPGVAFFVFGMFWIVFGLVQNGLVERFGPAFFLLILPLAWVQLKTLATLLRLNRKLLRASPVALPAT
jgi:Na+/H+ antiporter NhaD/arsenite permease-like protein